MWKLPILHSCLNLTGISRKSVMSFTSVLQAVLPSNPRQMRMKSKYPIYRQSAFSEGGLALRAGLEDLGKGLRSQVGTMYGTLAKGPRYLEMAEGYVTGIALDKDDQIIGYKFVNLKLQDTYGKTLEELIDEHGDAGFIKIENAGTGIPTNKRSAIKRPLPAFCFNFSPPLCPFSIQKVKNLPKGLGQL